MLCLATGFTQTSYHITTAQGLATNQLTVVIKDRENNMWFGSYNGLHKHEGTVIKVYNQSGKDSASLSSKEMHAVFEDRQGCIWAGTTGGLDKLDPGTGILQHYKLKPTGSTDDRIGYIISIFQDDRDNIWIVTEVAVFLLNYSTGKSIELSNAKNGQGIPDIGILYKGSVKTKTGLWMFASGYMIFYDFKKRQFIHQYNNPQQKKIFNLRKGNQLDGKSELCADSSGNLYFVFNNTLLMKYNLNTEKLDSFQFQSPINAWQCCYALATDYKGNVWIGFRYGGLLFFNSSSGQFTPIRHNNINSIIQSNYIYSLCEDYLKRMWVTTNNGIFIINQYDSIVQQYYLSERNEFVNINYPAGIISKDDRGNIYIPFYAGGIFSYNMLSGSNRYFPVTDTSIKGYSYAFTTKGKTYIGTGGTLKLADTSSHDIKFPPSRHNIYSALAKQPGRIAWAYEYNQQAVYFKKTDGVIYYYNGTDSLEKLVSTGFSKQACVSADKNYLYFLDTNSDIVKRNLATRAMQTFSLTKKLQALNFSFANTRDIADDGRGNIWITSQNGLIKFTLANQQVAIYTTTDGLLHDFSFTLCVDSKQQLWVGSMGGVNVYDAGKNSFLNVFPESPDKLSNYFGSSIEGADGRIYFLFGGKLVKIDPVGFFTQIKKERIIHLNEVKVNGLTVNSSGNFLSNLPYTHNRLYFRFGLLEFTEPGRVRYFYQLLGLDKTWVALGNHSELTFNALSPGNYTLMVKAVDSYGNDVDGMLKVPVHIQPPFWKTWWFILIIFVCIISMIYAFIKWREKNIKAIATEKLKVQQLNAEQFKSRLELEQIINYFSFSLIDKNTVDDVLWDVAKNLIGRLGFMDCMIYRWNADKTKMIQKAGFGPKDSAEEINQQVFQVLPGQGVVGFVIQTKEPVVIADTSVDNRYRSDDLVRLSEITVPVMYNNELIGVIDSEHPEKHFFTSQHLHLLNTIATLVANKINAIEAEQSLQQTQLTMYSMKEQLAKAKLEALRSQMNPHFIFNSLNAIQECILTNQVDAAYQYLSQFSKLQRMVLNNSEKELIPLSSEIEMIQLYLSLESLRFSKSFSYSMNMEGLADADEIMIPSLITQPLVENAVWHGLRNKEGDKILEIVYEEKDGFLFITIEDNGIGREKAAMIKNQKLGSGQYASKATAMMQQRLGVISQQFNVHIQLTIIDKRDDAGNASGTKATLSFPLNLAMA